MAYPSCPFHPPVGFFVFAAALLAGPAHAATASALLGHAVTFSVTAAGTVPFTYRWYKNGVAIPNATQASFAISSIQITDAGIYTVVVANAAGSVTSDQAVLSILGTNVSAAATGASIAPATATGVVSGAAATLGTATSGAAPAGTLAAASQTAPVAGGPAGVVSAAGLAGPDPANPGAWRVVSIDARGDGRTDVVWQNTVSGAAELWIMDGSTVVEVIPLADLAAAGAPPP